MKKNLRLLLWVFLPLLALITAFILSLTTEVGFRALAGLCDVLSGPVFSVERVQGRFLSNWQLEKVQVHVPGAVHLEFEELSCQWQPAALFDKELHLRSLKSRGLQVRLEKNDESGKESSPPVLSNIRLPFALRIDDLQVHDADIVFSDEAEPFSVTELIFQASVRDDQVIISRLKLESPRYGGDLQASVQLSAVLPVQVSGNWRVADPGIGDLSGSVRANGDMETLQVSIGLKSPAAAKIQGQLTNLLDDLHWQATGETEHFALGDLKLDLPVDGSLTVVEASGTLQNYGGTLTADIRYQDYPQVQARAEVQGDFDGLNIHLLQISLDQASLTANGALKWKDGFSWQTELQGEGLDPGRFMPQWPGTVNTRLLSQGSWHGNSLVADLLIEQLQGELRGYGLEGSGKAEYDGEALLLEKLHLQSGDTQLDLNGSVSHELDLAFNVYSADLASLVPGGSGLFQLQGTVGGLREEPVLAATLNAADLKIEEYALQSLTGVVNADLTEQGYFDAELEGSNIHIQDEHISKVHFQLQGTQGEHQLDLSLAGSLGGLQFALAGGIKEQSWEGELSRFLLQSDQFGSWKIKQAVPLRLAEESCEITEFCFLQDQVQVFLTGKWKKEGGWQVRGGLENFSLQLLEKWQLFTPKLDGVLNATMMVGGKGMAVDFTKLTVSIPDLSLTAKDPAGDLRTWQWTENSLHAFLEKGDAKITARTLFQDTSVVEIDAVLSNCYDFKKPEEISLNGTLNLDIKDLSPIIPFTQYTVIADGSLVGSSTLQGTLARPFLKGKIALQDGEIGIPAAGIRVQDLQLVLDGDGYDNTFALAMTSGKGSVELAGVVSQSAEKEWQADFTVQGKDFQAVDISEYTAAVSPDIRCVYGKEGVSLRGRMDVPRARIAPAGLQGAVSSSRDIVLVNGNGEQEKNVLPISLDLDVSLGEEVEVDGFGIRGRLDGRLNVHQKPGQAVTGLGNLNLRGGTFTFSDSTLEIMRGLVFYQGGPIDDPGLDVRARKKVGDKVVGVQMTGSVTRMEMDLFSDPHMDNSDILAYLLLGRDMSSASDKEGSLLGTAAATLGVEKGGEFIQEIEEETGLKLSLANGEESSDVSLVVGKEIYDDLYISYGKGMTDSAGTFKARYDLKKGFSVETEVTAEGTGADLFWSLER